MRYLLTFLTMITLAACGTISPNWTAMARWDIILLGSSGRNFCSGTVIGGGRDEVGEYAIILSAAHCANSPDYTVSRKIDFAGGIITDTKPAILLGKDAVADVAIFRSPISSNHTCVSLRRNVEYTRGDTVYILANPLITFYTALTKGVVSAPLRVFPINTIVMYLFQIDAQAAPGSSGGAVLDADGYLIGTVTGGVPGTAISVIAPVSGAISLIDKLNIGEDICYG